MAEILNIQYHERRLILKALNKYSTREEQAAALKIDKRTIYKKIEEYAIEKVENIFITKRKLCIEVELEL